MLTCFTGISHQAIMANQKGDQAPIGETPLKPEDRYELTKQYIKNLKPNPLPPKGFEPLKASNSELVKYGYPARPDEGKHPKHLEKWSSFLARPIQVIAPEFAIIRSGRQPANSTTQGDASANATSSNWSGAVVVSPPSGQTFNTVSGSWVVPNAWPPLSAWNGTGWNNGSWESVSWIGIDGYTAQQSILQAGTKSVVTVTNGTVTHSSWAWFEWYPLFETQFSNFQVSPGDTVHFLLCSTSPTQGVVIVNNISSNKGTSINISAPSAATALAGKNVEWILEDDTLGSSPAPFSDYGAEFFYDCLGGTGKTEVNISNATLVNMVQKGVTLSTAVMETPSVLMTYTGSAGP